MGYRGGIKIGYGGRGGPSADHEAGLLEGRERGWWGLISEEPDGHEHVVDRARVRPVLPAQVMPVRVDP